MLKTVLIVFLLLALSSCADLPPKNAENVCSIFKENVQWYEDAQQASQRWAVPIAILMAMMYQESHFVADAKPPRTWLLGFIPWTRPSSAFGYAQALDNTWEAYLDSAGSFWSDRDEFADAIDFIGWYNHLSHAHLGISRQNAKQLYFAYHEGHEGYRHRSYIGKSELQKSANNVTHYATVFQNQLNHCQIN